MNSLPDRPDVGTSVTQQPVVWSYRRLGGGAGRRESNLAVRHRQRVIRAAGVKRNRLVGIADRRGLRGRQVRHVDSGVEPDVAAARKRRAVEVARHVALRAARAGHVVGVGCRRDVNGNGLPGRKGVAGQES